VPIDETLRALDDLVRSGKVRYIGTSTFAGWQLVESLWESERLHLNRFVSEQPRYSLIDRRIEREVVPAARKYGIAVLPYSPLGGGVLTGKYRAGSPFPEESRARDASWGGWAQSFLSERVYLLVDLLVEIAGEHCCTPGQVALAWVLSKPGFGIATFRAHVLPRWAGGLLALNAVLVPVGALVPPDVQPKIMIPIGLALVWLGYALFSERRENVSETWSGTGSTQLRPAAAE
jgi:hypothetical protein